jgi:hypothetical protein
LSQENSDQACLFGWPAMPWKGARGRPPHVPTEENINKVKLLMALDWTAERIANALGISQPTLRRHYLSVLKLRALARDALDARRAELLWQQVEKGNVGAMKQFGQMVEEADRKSMSRKVAAAEDGDDLDAGPVKATGYVKKTVKAADQAQAALMIDPDLQPGRGGLPH